jgi:hypothetical protein
VSNAFSVEYFLLDSIGEKAADFFHGFSGAGVRCADEEDNAVDELEGMVEHEAFHFAVVASAPVRTGEECPADFNFALCRVEVGVAGGADDFLGFAVDGHEGASRRERILEEGFENVLLVSVGDWVQLPDQRIRSDAEEFLPIVGAEGAKFEEIADKVRLEVERFQMDLRFGMMPSA